MKIAFVNQPWNECPAKSGSVAVVTYQIARRLARQCDVVVYARADALQPKQEYQEGIHYRRFSINFDRRLLRFYYKYPSLFIKRKPLFASKLFYSGYILKVATDLKRQGCDIVHVQNFSQFVPFIKSLNPQSQVVLNMRCEWLTQLDKAIIHKRIKKTAMIIGCSNHITESIAKRFPEYKGLCKTVYNGVDLEQAAISAKAKNPDPHKSRSLLYVGRISPEKGLHVLLEAFTAVLERYPDTELRVVGGGSAASREYMVDIADSNEVRRLSRFYASQESYATQLQAMLSPAARQQVSFIGTVPQSEVFEYCRKADVLINPSLMEAFGIALIEAMACGVPVIGTRVGGIPEIVVEGQTGLLVAPGDAKKLAEAIVQLLAHEDNRLAMGRAGRDRVERLFTYDKMAEDMLQCYTQIVNLNRSRLSDDSNA